MGVEIRGLDRLQRKSALVPRLARKAAINATNEVTDTVYGHAVENAQRRFLHPTGETVGSLKTEVVENSEGSIVGRLFSDKKTSFFTEFGTGKVGQESNAYIPPNFSFSYTQTPWFFPTSYTDRDLALLYGMKVITIQGVDFYWTRGQKARPWMRPALISGSEDAPEIYERHVKQQLRELRNK